jgi:hypothetical protein
MSKSKIRGSKYDTCLNKEICINDYELIESSKYVRV